MSPLLLIGAAFAGVPVDCAWSDGVPWCTASVQIDAPLATVDGILSDFDGLPDIFPRIQSSSRLEDSVIYVVLEMPFPLAPRDYIARFTREEVGGEVRLHWVAAEHPAAPQTTGRVRLLSTAGTWTLRPDSTQTTEVIYRWNAELGGDIPTWALPRAWQMQGDEVLGRLKSAAESAGK
jgi:carbon monoxide dehydrogenase subunit G